MPDWLSQRAARSAHKTALLFEGRAFTFGQLQDRVSGVCAQLHGLGIRPGNRVAVYLPNSLEMVLLVHALVRLQVLIVPLNTRLTVPETAFQLKAAAVDWLIGAPNSPPEIQALVPEAARIMAADLDPNPPAERRWAVGRLDLTDPWGIIFTSGTTGRPKGAVLTYGNLYFSALASAHRLGLESASRWLLAMPMYHIGGLSILFRCCLYGTAVHLLDKFDLRDVAQALDSGAVTLVSLVPTMLQRLMIERSWATFPKGLQLVLLGGAAAPQKLLQRCLAAGVPVASTYGLSEAASQVATALPHDVAAKPGTVGKPLAGTEVRIAGSDGVSLQAGEIGEITLRGPTVAPGYLDGGWLPEITAPYRPNCRDPLPKDAASLEDALKQAGPPQAFPWFSSGDLGYLDSDGDLWVVQRRSDLIVTGGENVYPAEVERALESQPGVETAFVFGSADEEWGQRVCALVVPDSAGPPEKDVLLAQVRQQLAGYKMPRRLVFVNELPLTASGKIDRRRAAELFEKGEQL